MAYPQVAHLMLQACLSLAMTFRFLTSLRPMTKPDSLLGWWHTALACDGLRVLTCAPASGIEAGCRNPEASTIFYCIFKVRFQYLPFFSSFPHRAIQSLGTENVSLSPILTSRAQADFGISAPLRLTRLLTTLQRPI